MTLDEKREAKELVKMRLVIIEKQISIMRTCLLIAGKDDFSSDYVVMAKDRAREVQMDCQEVEHILHELIDAPLLSDDVENEEGE